MTDRAIQPAHGRPTRSQIAAARLIVKRDQEGKGNLKPNSFVRQLATMERYPGELRNRTA